MSFLDRIASAVMLAASAQDRADARLNAQRLAQGHDWLAEVLEHHRQIEQAFDAALNADGAEARRAATNDLGILLTGHSMAEEAVLYPAIVEYSGKTNATMAFEEQSMAKVQFAQLEKLDPSSQQWREKLEHIKSAVEQHVYQEESNWYPEVLENIPAHERGRLTERYNEEFSRYCTSSADRPAVPLTAPG